MGESKRRQGNAPKKQAAKGVAPMATECDQLVALFKAGRLAELENGAHSLLERYPDSGFAWKMLSAALQMQGKDSLRAMQKTTELLPDDAEMHNNLGLAFQERGRLDEAEASYRRALQIKSDFTDAHINLGNIYSDLGRLDKAQASYRRALQIKPNFASAHYNLGNTLMKLGQPKEAEASYRRALQIKPDFVNVHINLANILGGLGRLGESEASYRRALQIKPNSAETHCGLGITLMELGRLDEAETNCRKALEIKPDFAMAYSNLLFLYGYHALVDPHEYLAQARNWEQACLPAQDRQAARHRVFQRPPLAGRRLKVGYVSGDFRQHSVSYFIEQLFAHHDRARIELFAYSTHGQRDAVTERLQALAEHWVPLVGIPDATIRERIEADGIDVLIDLSGHTKHNRLGVFARRAAPVQAYYLGYFASTGLTEMDYWIGDEILTPPETDSHFSEQVWRLPRVSWSYVGKDAPPPNWLPASDGTVWVGSFNNLGKLTPATLTLWAKVLYALPEGKLLLKAKELGDINNRQRILDTMAGHGILPDRIELQDSNTTPNWSDHMAYYDRLDIALDPVGAMGGVTTTCDALWMGTPVITLEGDRVSSRATAAILSAIGHTEWIAHSEAEYIGKVIALAHDVEQRKVLRSGQRSRVASSPLCDARDLAMSLENAYVEMFERWQKRQNEQPYIAS